MEKTTIGDLEGGWQTIFVVFPEPIFGEQYVYGWIGSAHE